MKREDAQRAAAGSVVANFYIVGGGLLWLNEKVFGIQPIVYLVFTIIITAMVASVVANWIWERAHPEPGEASAKVKFSGTLALPYHYPPDFRGLPRGEITARIRFDPIRRGKK